MTADCETDFLLPNTACTCDVDYRCPNHDTDAEMAYWLPLRKVNA